MGVMSMLNTLGSGISHLLLRPHGDVSHLGGATTQKNSTQGATWDDSGWVGVAWLKVMDSKTGLLQVHLLCSGSGAKTAWQWRDTKSLPVKEAGGRPPIKTQRLWVTFHRAQLLGCDSMPTHYSWRVVCLVCACVQQLAGCHCYNSVCVTTWLFFYLSLFDYF